MTPGCPLGPAGPGGPERPSCPEIPYNHRRTREKYYASGLSWLDRLFRACHLKHYCLWNRTYSRSNFSIRARASRATSHTLEKKDKVNQCRHRKFAPEKIYVAEPTLDPGAPGAPGFPDSPVAPWGPIGPGEPRSPGTPCQERASRGVR